VVAEMRKLLEYFYSVPDDFQPLRYIDDPEPMDANTNVASPAAIFLWLGILWLKYRELIPQVRNSWRLLRRRSLKVAERQASVCVISHSVVGSGLGKAEAALEQDNTRSTHPAAIALGTRVNNFQQAMVSLVILRRD
jgi:hypothetical protein